MQVKNSLFFQLSTNLVPGFPKRRLRFCRGLYFYFTLMQLQYCITPPTPILSVMNSFFMWKAYNWYKKQRTITTVPVYMWIWLFKRRKGFLCLSPSCLLRLSDHLVPVLNMCRVLCAAGTRWRRPGRWCGASACWTIPSPTPRTGSPPRSSSHRSRSDKFAHFLFLLVLILWSQLTFRSVFNVHASKKNAC